MYRNTSKRIISGMLMLVMLITLASVGKVEAKTTTNWKKIYKDFIIKWEPVLGLENDIQKFALVYVDSDAIPELYVEESWGQTLYRINNKSVEVIIEQNYRGRIEFSTNKKNIIYLSHSGGGGYDCNDYWFETYSNYEKGKTKDICYKSYYVEKAGYLYKIGNKSVSKNQYESKVKKLKKNSKMVTQPSKLYTKEQIVKKLSGSKQKDYAKAYK